MCLFVLKILQLFSYNIQLAEGSPFTHGALVKPQEPFYHMWNLWKELHNKKYDFYEERWRFDIWVSNFHQVGAHNSRFREGRETYLQAMNKFSECRKPELTLKYTSIPNFSKKFNLVRLPPQEVPENRRWVDYGWPNSQSFPDDGWAFSATGAVQAQIYNVTGKIVKLSLDELKDCVERVPGRSLLSIDAFSYIQQNGVTLDSHYPERNPKWGFCRRKRNHPKRSITSYHILEQEDEENLKIAVALIGPISVNIKVTRNFFFYKFGVFFDHECHSPQKVTNHAVLLVGYGFDAFGGEYWIIQNNWGTQWGENGMCRMSRNTMFNCGIAAAAAYPVI